jgi:sterol desaturase/sphingolipid hydroxylase (fatty acid hydroxylase superfamily)
MLILALIAIMAVVVAGLIVLEYRSGVRGTDWRNNLVAWAMLLAGTFFFAPLLPLWQGHALVDGSTLSFWWALPIYIVVHDLGEYLYHRAQHRIPVLWAMHALHHSDTSLSVLTTQRHFWGDPLIKTVTVWSAASLIISPTFPLVLAYTLLSLWNFATHSALRIDFGRWSWLLNSPAYHRRHHSSLPEHYDSNFAALLPIFDVIAGSYHRPDGFPPTGLDSKPKSMIEIALWPIVFSGWTRPKPVPPLRAS